MSKNKNNEQGYIWSVNKRNFLIYALALVISFLFCGLYFIDITCPWCILSCSVGASGVGAVVLAFFIERANNIRLKKEQDGQRKYILSSLESEIDELLYFELEFLSWSLYARKKNENYKVEKLNLSRQEIVIKINKLLEQYYIIPKNIENIEEKQYYEKFKNIAENANVYYKNLDVNINNILGNNGLYYIFKLFNENDIKEINKLKFLICSIIDESNKEFEGATVASKETFYNSLIEILKSLGLNMNKKIYIQLVKEVK